MIAKGPQHLHEVERGETYTVYSREVLGSRGDVEFLAFRLVFAGFTSLRPRGLRFSGTQPYRPYTLPRNRNLAMHRADLYCVTIGVTRLSNPTVIAGALFHPANNTMQGAIAPISNLRSIAWPLDQSELRLRLS